MRERGHADAGELSPAQLTELFKWSRRERALRDLRALMIAAAGASGGKAFKHLARTIEDEIKLVSREGREAGEEEQSSMPLSAEDFERMLKEDNGG